MTDTIVAQATGGGLAGLAVIRISGPNAVSLAAQCFRGKKNLSNAASHTIAYGSLYDGNIFIDNVTASVFRAPHSYTGEDTVELGAHGGAVVPAQIVRALLNCGCKLAKPGEFTKRAFLNGKLNLLQAEAVADLIHATSIPSAEVSAKQMRSQITNKLAELRNNLINTAATLELEIDFAHEDITIQPQNALPPLINSGLSLTNNLLASYQAASSLRNGFVVALCGPPNAGKSTLFNALLQYERAIVNEAPGTTRDLISEMAYFNNMPVKLYDTAGLRQANEPVEQKGIEYSMKILAEANIILYVNDCSQAAADTQFANEIQAQFPNKTFAFVQNKIDLLCSPPPQSDDNTFYVAANIYDERLEKISQFIGTAAAKHAAKSTDILLNERQYHKLSSIKQTLQACNELIAQNAGAELVSIELREAGQMLDELTGQSWNEAVLDSVFSQFCIGK